MKLIFLMFTFIATCSVVAQPETVDFLYTKIKRQNAYIELHNDKAIIFLTEYKTQGHYAYSVLRDTVILEKEGNGGFTAKNWRIQRIDDVNYLIPTSGASGLESKYVLQEMGMETEWINGCVNEAYWFAQMEKMSKELKSRYPLFTYGSFNAIDTWLDKEEKRSDYRLFSQQTDRIMDSIRAVLIVANTEFTRSASAIFQAIDQSDYPQFRDSMAVWIEKYQKFGAYTYRDSILQRVCSAKSEWFFQLEEDLPESKSIFLRWGISAPKSFVAPLRSVESHRKLRRELFRKRCNNRLAAGSIFTLAIAGDVALIGGIIYLIAR